MNSKRTVSKKRALIVAHDAGGAEIVSSWVKRHTEYNYDFILAGPASNIFKSKLVNITISAPEYLLHQIIKSDFVLTGTSWASDLEKKAIYLAKQNKVKVYSFLDHWIDYLSRFQYRGNLVLPDEIWVGDRPALKEAKNYFPAALLRLKKNPYFLDIKEELALQKSTKTNGKCLKILYVCEPISEQSIKQYGHPNHWGYTEYEAVERFLGAITSSRLTKKIAEICFRLHPSETKSKYKEILKSFSELPITLGSGRTLLMDCVWADWVVGCESTAMVIGLLAGRTVFSTIPKDNIPCSLPHKKIRRFFK